MTTKQRLRKPCRASLISDTDRRIAELRKALGIDSRAEKRLAAIARDMRALEAGFLTPNHRQ